MNFVQGFEGNLTHYLCCFVNFLCPLKKFLEEGSMNELKWKKKTHKKKKKKKKWE